MRLHRQPEPDMSAFYSAPAIRARYAEIRRKLWGKPVRKAAPAPAPDPEPEPAVVEATAPAAPVVTLPTDRVRAIEIGSVIAARYGVTLAHLLASRRRFRHLVQARFEIMWTLRREFPDWSLPRIARFMGGLDHTTVLHGIREHERKRAVVEGFAAADEVSRDIAKHHALPFATLFLPQKALAMQHKERVIIGRARGKVIRKFSRERGWSNYKISVYFCCDLRVVEKALRFDKRSEPGK